MRISVNTFFLSSLMRGVNLVFRLVSKKCNFNNFEELWSIENKENKIENLLK